MKLKTSQSTAEKLLKGIPHATCQRGLDEHWVVGCSGEVLDQSVFWLACWAWTGMGSESARKESERVFNAIFPVNFSTFKSHIPHAVARKNRYRTAYDGPTLNDLGLAAEAESAN